MKKILISLCIVASTSLVEKSIHAQTTEQKGALLESRRESHKIMIIPFNQFNYFSDADQDLAQINKKQTSEISTYFRYGLNYNIQTRIISVDQYNILSDTTVESYADLKKIYASIKYDYEKPMNAFAKDSNSNKSIEQKDLFGFGNEQETEVKKNSTIFFNKEVVEDGEQQKYLNAILKRPSVLEEMYGKYGTDIFLFINQFELITNYNHCLDRSANYFERKVLVHYSIYNKEGKQLEGNAVMVTFSTKETDIDLIIANHFSFIADYLNQSIQNTLLQTTK